MGEGDAKASGDAGRGEEAVVELLGSGRAGDLGELFLVLWIGSGVSGWSGFFSGVDAEGSFFVDV